MCFHWLKKSDKQPMIFSFIFFLISLPLFPKDALNFFYFVLFFGCAVQHAGSSPTRDWTWAPCSGSTVLTTGPPGKSWYLVFIEYFYPYKSTLIAIISFYSHMHFIVNQFTDPYFFSYYTIKLNWHRILWLPLYL